MAIGSNIMNPDQIKAMLELDGNKSGMSAMQTSPTLLGVSGGLSEAKMATRSASIPTLGGNGAALG